MTTAYITDTRFAVHHLRGHVENAERLNAIQSRLESAGIPQRTLTLEPVPASDQQILTVHTEEYLELLKWSQTQSGLQFGPDTYVLPKSFEAAQLSAGAALRAVDAVLGGEAHNALVCARPPGHHAIPQMAMGFCLLANVAIAARYAQSKYGLKRILVVDYDVHHGNGTQDIFYDDSSVLFISTHQYSTNPPFYPGSGAAEETGAGAGEGATINIPFPAGVSDKGYAAAYEQIVWPAARRFQPELILVSAGFDAHWADPLAGMQLTLTGYRHLSEELVRMADVLCNGKVIFVLEGGYNLDALSHGVLYVAYALLRDAQVNDPLGPPKAPIPDVTTLVEKIKQIHEL